MSIATWKWVLTVNGDGTTAAALYPCWKSYSRMIEVATVIL